MTVRKLSPTFDFQFGNSQLDFMSNTPATVAQVAQTSFLLWLGEWYLDVTQGMPWMQGVLGKHNQSTADVTIQDFATGIQGVTSVANFSSAEQRDIRLYSGSIELNTVYGPTTVQIANQRLF